MSGETPWIRGDLRVAKSIVDQIERHAEESYPSEACGFISGPASDGRLLDATVRELNEADKFHALDPETFPRTSHTYFKINELRAARAFEAGTKAGQPIKVIYHSHCDAGAYFSSEDAETFAQGGALMWPCAFLVVSVKEGRAVDRKLWVHVPGTDTFTEAQLTIE